MDKLEWEVAAACRRAEKITRFFTTESIRITVANTELHAAGLEEAIGYLTEARYTLTRKLYQNDLPCEGQCGGMFDSCRCETTDEYGPPLGVVASVESMTSCEDCGRWDCDGTHEEAFPHSIEEGFEDR